MKLQVMKRTFIIILQIFLIFVLFSCGGKEESVNMIDMDTIRNDGSHNEEYIFRHEIERDKKRSNKYKDNKF